jgi:hypothetical protein
VAQEVHRFPVYPVEQTRQVEANLHCLQLGIAEAQLEQLMGMATLA